jgi:hypothetical protein
MLKKYRIAIVGFITPFIIFAIMQLIPILDDEQNTKQAQSSFTANSNACMSVKGYIENLNTLTNSYMKNETTHEEFISELQNIVNYLTFARDMANGSTATAIDEFATEVYLVKQEGQYDPEKINNLSYDKLLTTGSRLAEVCK